MDDGSNRKTFQRDVDKDLKEACKDGDSSEMSKSEHPFLSWIYGGKK